MNVFPLGTKTHLYEGTEIAHTRNLRACFIRSQSLDIVIKPFPKHAIKDNEGEKLKATTKWAVTTDSINKSRDVLLSNRICGEGKKKISADQL